MKAISIRQPWASMIMAGTKTVENRSWPTRFRGRLALHTSAARVDPGATDDMPRGMIVGTVTVVDCHRADDPACRCTRWAEPGGWHWLLADPQPFDTPQPARGRLGLWNWD